MISKLLIGALFAAATLRAQSYSGPKLDSASRLKVINAQTEWVEHAGRRALRLAPLAGHEQDTDQEMIAVLEDTDFRDGVVEVDVSGARRAGYAADNAAAHKGHIGISF